MNRRDRSNGTDALSFILGAFCAVAGVALVIVIRAIFIGWRAAIGLP